MFIHGIFMSIEFGRIVKIWLKTAVFTLILRRKTMKRSHFLMIVLITIFISIGAVACGNSDEAAPAEETTTVVDQPVVDAPVVDAPVVDAPVDAPVVDAPVVDAPVVDVPVVDAPATDAYPAPVTDAPVGGVEGDAGVGGAAGDPTADQVAVDPNAGGAAPEASADAATTDTATTTATETAVTAPAVDITKCDPPNVPVTTGAYYTVKACDNLYRIGLSYGLSWTVIANANGIYYPDYILVGQTLYIPGQPMPVPAPAPAK
jgi:LysM repeat protein